MNPCIYDKKIIKKYSYKRKSGNYEKQKNYIVWTMFKMINKFIFAILTIIFANKQTELDMQTRSIIEDVFHFGYNPAATFYYLNEFFHLH